MTKKGKIAYDRGSFPTALKLWEQADIRCTVAICINQPSLSRAVQTTLNSFAAG